MAYTDTYGLNTPGAVTLSGIAGAINNLLTSSGPLTFTEWTPTYGGTGSMTYTSTSKGRYVRIGKILLFYLGATGTTGGSAGGGITFTPPLTLTGSYLQGGGGAFVYDNGLYRGGFWVVGSTTLIQVWRYDGGNWTIGANEKFAVCGILEVA